jgi:hypothetical protein
MTEQQDNPVGVVDDTLGGDCVKWSERIPENGTKLYTAPPSVEALQKEVERLTEKLVAEQMNALCLEATNAAQAERIAELEAGLHKIYEIDDTGPMVFETENGRSYPAGLSKGKSAQIAKTLVVAKPQAGEKHD